MQANFKLYALSGLVYNVQLAPKSQKPRKNFKSINKVHLGPILLSISLRDNIAVSGSQTTYKKQYNSYDIAIYMY